MAGATLQVMAAGLPCAIGYTGNQWRVTVADVAYADDPVLAAAIVEAFGGLIERSDAIELAESIEGEAVVRASHGPQAESLWREGGDRRE